MAQRSLAASTDTLALAGVFMMASYLFSAVWDSLIGSVH
jgi:hypothetical protein